MENTENIFSEIPKNYDEFIQFNNIDEWPFRLTSEKIIPLKEELVDFQDIGYIKDCLENQISINILPLDDLETRRLQHERYLMSYVNQIFIVDNIINPKPNNMLMAKLEGFEKLGEKIRLTSKEIAFIRKYKETESSTIHELNLKSIELYNYAGFNDLEFNDLPGTSDAMRLIHLAVRNTKIPKVYRHTYKKIFFSEASVGIILDIFWWIFLDYFKNETKNDDKEKLFSRTALNYGILMNSIPDIVKDGFLQVFPEQIALTLYCAFYYSFSDSRRLFGPDFKQKLVNICHLWMTGMHPLPNSFNMWPIDKILSNKDSCIDEKADMKGSLPKIKSHPIGPSFSYSKTLFDFKGCCPLIHRFLQIYDIEPNRTSHSKCGHRLEVMNSVETDTYKDQVKHIHDKMDKMKKIHDDSSKEHEQEITLIIKKRKDLEKRFERLENVLNSSRSILDMRVSVDKFAKE